MYTQPEQEFLLSKGAKIERGPYSIFKGQHETTYNFGLITDKDIDQIIAEAKYKEDIPVYELPTRGAPGDKWCAWWTSMVQEGPGKIGKHFLVMDQKVGSCVMQGAIQAVRYRNSYEVYTGDLDQVVIPFGGLAYGKSRQYGGMNNRGDGSFGSTMAKAMGDTGLPDAANPMFPRWSDQGGIGITWGANVEYDYSVGRNLPPDQLALGKNHLVVKVQQITSLDQLEAAILIDGMTATCASNWGGLMQCPTQGGEYPVLLNRRSGSWAHQMSVHGVWIHPVLSRIWYILNSWSIRAHGTPPDDSPPGGFWVKDADMQSIVSQDEVYVVSGYSGLKIEDLGAREVAKLRTNAEGKKKRRLKYVAGYAPGDN